RRRTKPAPFRMIGRTKGRATTSAAKQQPACLRSGSAGDSQQGSSARDPLASAQNGTSISSGSDEGHIPAGRTKDSDSPSGIGKRLTLAPSFARTHPPL